MYSAIDVSELPDTGFPIQKSPAQCLFNGSPKLIAVNHVFHRHPTPRHPPSALNNLAINIYLLCQFSLFGAFENVLPCIQFSKNLRGLPHPQALAAPRQALKADSSKILFIFQLPALISYLVEVNGFLTRLAPSKLNSDVAGLT
jgi:hypothetical protein